MLPIILGTLMGVFTMLVGFFTSIANFQAMVEDDFMDRANTNAAIHSLQLGQLYSRANILNTTNNQMRIRVADSLREENNRQYENITYVLTLNNIAGVSRISSTTEMK